MKALVIVRRIRVENANAVSGFTWGFPGISHFLGLTHSLSRSLEKRSGVHFLGCGIVAHNTQVKAHRAGRWDPYHFSLARHPLTKEGKVAAINEEARMNMEVSLVLSCDFTLKNLQADDEPLDQTKEAFIHWLKRELLDRRVAAGSPTDIDRIDFLQLNDDLETRAREVRRCMLRLLPGFTLVERRDLLDEHFDGLRRTRPEATLVDAWLDFASVKWVPEVSGDDDVEESKRFQWRPERPVDEGWLVPIQVGYSGISPVYEAGSVQNVRDPSMPFCFVEAAHSLGQWISPHRVADVEQILWHYEASQGSYYCTNEFWD